MFDTYASYVSDLSVLMCLICLSDTQCISIMYNVLIQYLSRINTLFYLPPPSTPRATGHSPAQTTAADPLDEPPEILFGSYGFRVVLHYSERN